MSTAKTRAYNTTDAMNCEGKLVKPENEGEDSVESIIQQAFGKDPFLSFSRSAENPVQLIHLLNALDQQGNNKVYGSSKAENCVQEVENSLELCNGTGSFLYEMKGSKESNHSLKGNGIPVKGGKSTSEQMQSLKFPEAVAAFAQAAAKANGEPEKCLPGWPLLSPKVQLQKCSKCSLEFCSSINYRRHMRVHRRPLNIVKDSPKTRKLLGAFWDKLLVDEAKELVSFQNASLEEVTGSSIMRSLQSWVRKLGFTSLPQAYVKAGVTLLDVIQARHSRFPISSQELFSALDDASEKTFLCSGTALSVQKYVFDGEAGKNALEMKNLVACASFLLEQILVKAWIADKDAEALRCQKLLVEEEEAAQKRKAVLLERKRLKKLRQKQQKGKEQSDGEKVDSKVSLLDGAEGSCDAIATPSPRSPLESELNTSEAWLDQDPPSLDHMVLREEADSAANLRQPFQLEDEHWPVPSQCVRPKQTRKSLNSCARRGKPVPLANGHKIWTPKSKAESQVGGGMNGREPPPDELVFDKTKVMIGSISVALGDSDIRENVVVRSDSSGEEVKLWRPVNLRGNENAAEVDGVTSVTADHISSGMDGRDLSEPRLFSREVAEAFLAERWRKAMTSDHVKLVLSPVNDQSDPHETPEGAPLTDHNTRVILASTENQMMIGVSSIEPASALISKPKFKPKNAEKSYTLKYVPKKKSNTIRE